VRRRRIATVAAVALAAVLAAGPVRAQTPEERLLAAKGLYEDGQFTQAAAALREVLAGQTEADVRLEANLYLGFAELQSGHEAEAKAAFAEVLAQDPNYRLDPLRFAPKLRDAFEQVRVGKMAGPEEVLGITIVQAEGVLTPAEKPPKAFAGKWWQKWWVIGLGVVAVGGTAAILGAGSGGPGAPAFEGAIEFLKTGCAPIPGQQIPGFPEGDLPVRVQFRGGQPPYDLVFFLDTTAVGTLSRVQQSPQTFTYHDLRVTGVGSSQTYTLRATLKDANQVSAGSALQTSISIRLNCPPP